MLIDLRWTIKQILTTYIANQYLSNCLSLKESVTMGVFWKRLVESVVFMPSIRQWSFFFFLYHFHTYIVWRGRGDWTRNFRHWNRGPTDCQASWKKGNIVTIIITCTFRTESNNVNSAVTFHIKFRMKLLVKPRRLWRGSLFLRTYLGIVHGWYLRVLSLAVDQVAEGSVQLHGRHDHCVSQQCVHQLHRERPSVRRGRICGHLQPGLPLHGKYREPNAALRTRLAMDHV